MPGMHSCHACIRFGWGESMAPRMRVDAGDIDTMAIAHIKIIAWEMVYDNSPAVARRECRVCLCMSSPHRAVSRPGQHAVIGLLSEEIGGGAFRA